MNEKTERYVERFDVEVVSHLLSVFHNTLTRNRLSTELAEQLTKYVAPYVFDAEYERITNEED